jgi:hypothetical protein
VKKGGGSGIVEKNKSSRTIENNIKRRLVEYSTIGCEVITAFIIIFGMCKKEGV